MPDCRRQRGLVSDSLRLSGMVSDTVPRVRSARSRRQAASGWRRRWRHAGRCLVDECNDGRAAGRRRDARDVHVQRHARRYNQGLTMARAKTRRL